ncbi:vesicle-trafficking protein SEC22c isoform X1 [Cyprinodon tularosa]|uniref:vesicle-trafficking protein SEC22c isoform X1 n=1 Tax=Cyprinodon tularosa TaxID=77115 RepID=UPI0018E281D1|nr:vesicle-trafficking protein SEC22c isoform X1 [Cyprinodon tularosa]XP_038149749.1 vesicle-trafficking protein SEC22c isoform X1 [Cyprinodon tularosa]
MSLILFAFVVRVRDGLPLSASTDFEHNKELQERKQQLRTISKSLAFYPDRGTLRGQKLNIYFVSSEGVSYMSVCHSSLPIAKAFCFLEDLRWEFTACFNSTVISLAARPYPFLEFDSTIQKLKQQYNQSGGPALEVTLAEVQEDLRIRPPEVINLNEVELVNGTANGHIEQSAASAGINQRLEPVSVPGILSLILNIMCASLNMIRGVHLVENTFQDDYEGIWKVVAFFLAFICCALQCHLYLFHSSQKKLKSFLLLSMIVLCNLYLFGMRNVWQLLFHISVASLSTSLILTRRLQHRTDDCGV